jgi:hypothetical protein
MKQCLGNNEGVLTNLPQSAMQIFSPCFWRIDGSGLPDFTSEKEKSNLRMYEKGKSFSRGNGGAGVKKVGLLL